MPNLRPTGEPVPIPKTAGRANGRGGSSSPSSSRKSTTPANNTNNHCHGHAAIERTTSQSESDSFPESAYVHPFSPGGNHWGAMSIPHKPVTLTVDSMDDGMDSMNLGDERDLGHRLGIISVLG